MKKFLFDKKQTQKTIRDASQAISDLETLLVPDLSLEKFESIVNQYSNPENDVHIDFEEASNHFKSGNSESFKKIIQESIEELNGVIKQL